MYTSQNSVPSVVADFGSSFAKVGFAGQETPQSVFHSVVAHEKETGTFFVGDSARVRRDGTSLLSPFRDGLVFRWELLEKIWQHAFKSISAESKEHGILLVEPSCNLRAVREKQARVAFETYQSPALFVCKNAALCCYSNARGTGVVLESGGSSTRACTVAEGYVVQKSLVSNEMSGRALDQVTLAAMRNIENVSKSSLRPRYAYKRETLPDGSVRIEAADYSKTDPTFREYMTLEIGREIRESVCRCSDKTFDAARSGNVPSTSYKLPDQTEIKVGAERFLIPELMFEPDALETRFNFIPAHTMVHMSVEKCGESRLRKTLLNNVVVAGGNTSYDGFETRLHREISARVSSKAQRVKVVGGLKTGDRRFTAWHGGSILASLDSFAEMWISKAEFEEHGPSIVDRKCP